MLPRRGKKIFFGGNGRVCDICSREALSGGGSAAPWTTASEAAGSTSASEASRASGPAGQAGQQGKRSARNGPERRGPSASTGTPQHSGQHQRRGVRSGQHRRSQHSTRATDSATTASTSTTQHGTGTSTTAQPCTAGSTARRSTHGRCHHAAAACAPGCNTYGVALIATLTITQAAHRRSRDDQRSAAHAIMRGARYPV